MCGCCCVPNKICAIVVGVIGLIELILAAVYNFHAFGFSVAIICLLASAGFSYYIFTAAK